MRWVRGGPGGSGVSFLWRPVDAGCWCGGLSLAEAGAGFARAGLVRSRRGPHWARVWRSRLREGGGWALRGVQGFVPAGERVLVGRGDAREDRYPLKPLRCRCTAISPLRGPNPLPVPRSRVLVDPCIYLYISFVHFHVWRRSGRVFTLRAEAVQRARDGGKSGRTLGA